jgi:hypothetical protein
VTVPAGSTTKTFALQVSTSSPKTSVTISARAGSLTKTVKVWIKRF